MFGITNFQVLQQEMSPPPQLLQRGTRAMAVSIPFTLLSKKKGFQEAHLGILDTEKTSDREE